MESKNKNEQTQLHFFFFPLMAQGHLGPIIHMAKLFASRGQRSTIITTPLQAHSLSKSLQNSNRIHFLTVTIPCSEVGLPDGTESLSTTKSPEDQQNFVRATMLLGPQLDEHLNTHRPDCLVSDMFFPWTVSVAARYGIPRVVFHGTCCFSLCASLSMVLHKPYQTVSSGSETFTIPKLPDEIVFTADKVPIFLKENLDGDIAKLYDDTLKADLTSYGVLVNSFYELEPAYPECYTKVLGVNKAWHIGPLLLYKEVSSKHDNDDKHRCLKWLDSKNPGSVIYICFGSLANISDAQLMEIAAGLEASGKEFIWVVKRENGEEEWLPEEFENRMEAKGLIIRGWAPQVLILNHEAVGAFVTHCGWNSTLEGVCAGVPMVTWPQFAEQFTNEKLINQVLEVGVEVGVTKWSFVGGDLVRREVVESVVKRVMEGEEADGMRSRVKKLAEMARRAVEEGGSSCFDLDSLFQDLRARRLAID